MLFAHDTEVALNAAAALVNSAHAEPDALATIADLDAFVSEWQWTGTRRRTRAELAAVHALRPRLERFWHLDEDGAAAKQGVSRSDGGYAGRTVIATRRRRKLCAAAASILSCI